MIRSYFSFSKKELNGILLLCIIVAIITIFPYIYRSVSKPEAYELITFKREIAAFEESALKQGKVYQEVRNQIEDKDFKADYFVFDPNDLAEKEWQKLGLSSRQIRVIKNYEAKGGRFYRKEDLKKIYSIPASQYGRLEPYIRIPSTYPKTFKASRPEGYKRPNDTYKGDAVIIIELNVSDSAIMESVRGIGPVFASRIIRYRSRLGGFYSKEQLREIYGLDSLKYSQLKDRVSVDASFIQKININTATFDQLKRHPYLSYKQMNAIIQYRKQHGDYRSIDDLKKVAILNEEIIRKIEPYLAF